MTGDQTQSTRRFFDRQAAAWASEYRAGGHMADRVARFLGAAQLRCPSGGDVLDLGCGSGEIAAAFANAGRRVTGCDLAPAMIEAAQARWPGRGIAWATLAPGGALPFATTSFDLVVSSSVLEYVEDLPACLAEVARVLRPDGWVCATVPDMRHAARRAEAAKRRIVLSPLLFPVVRLSPWRSTYEYLRISINRLSLAEWAALFRAAGLEPTVPAECEHPLALIAGQRRRAAV